MLSQSRAGSLGARVNWLTGILGVFRMHAGFRDTFTLVWQDDGLSHAVPKTASRERQPIEKWPKARGGPLNSEPVKPGAEL